MSTMTRTTVLVVLVAVVLGAGALLVVGDDATVRPGPDGVLEIVMEDYAFDAEEYAVPAGVPVTLRLVNRSDPGQHVSFGRAVVEVDTRPVAFEEDLLGDLDVRVTPAAAVVDRQPPYQGFMVYVRGGETVTLDVTFPQDRVGTWEIGCFTGRGCHYRAGLNATLVIE